MTDSIATADVEAAIGDVTHPEIDASLVDLGMIDALTVEGTDVQIDVAIPMLGIPQAVKEILRDRLATAVAETGGDLTVTFVEMDDEQRAAFFEMEERHWSGGLGDSDATPPF
ncbi:MAG: iron-sulfur cluster assembly protein [Halanaeroarchaeum sp.]